MNMDATNQQSGVERTKPPRVRATRIRAPRAFTLVELLIVVAIIGLLIALLLPAVQAARESSRLATCKSNLRQIALAALNFESQNGQLPPLWRGDEPTPWQNFSWRVAMLPLLEEAAVYDQLDFEQEPLAARNLPAAARRISIFQCPSTRGSRFAERMGAGTLLIENIQVATNDYSAVHDVAGESDRNLLRGIWNGGPRLDGSDGVGGGIPVDRLSAELRRMVPRLRRVRDGLSRTIFMVEQAGKPKGFAGGYEQVTIAPTEGPWVTAEYSSYFGEGVNVMNYTDPYGFHTGPSAAFGDGSILTIPPEISPEVLTALLSRDGNEIVDRRDW